MGALSDPVSQLHFYKQYSKKDLSLQNNISSMNIINYTSQQVLRLAAIFPCFMMSRTFTHCSILAIGPGACTFLLKTKNPNKPSPSPQLTSHSSMMPSGPAAALGLVSAKAWSKLREVLMLSNQLQKGKSFFALFLQMGRSFFHCPFVLKVYLGLGAQEHVGGDAIYGTPNCRKA